MAILTASTLSISSFSQIDGQLSTILSDNQTNAEGSATNWTGTIVTFPIVSKALMSNVGTDLLNATQIAIDDVGPGSTAVESTLRTDGGYLVYAVSVIDSNQNLHRVIVDSGSGEVLSNVERPNARYETGPVMEGPPDIGLMPAPPGNNTMMLNQSLPSE